MSSVRVCGAVQTCFICVDLLTVYAGVLDWGAIEESELQSILEEEDNVKTRIIFAREELKVRYLRI